MILGGTRGVGFAFAKRLLERATGGKVIIGGRVEPASSEFVSLRAAFPERLHFVSLDVTSEASIRNAAKLAGSQFEQLHLLINAAGVLHDGALQPEKRIEELSPEHLQRAFAVNAIGPMLTVKHFLPLLNHSDRAVIANLSARVGSIEDNRLGGWYGYRASKAAQNMGTRCLAIELARRAPKVVCLALHPGTVDTDLSKPFQRSVPKYKLFSPDRAAAQLLEIIDGAAPEQSGSFFAWDGQPIPW